MNSFSLVFPLRFSAMIILLRRPRQEDVKIEESSLIAAMVDCGNRCKNRFLRQGRLSTTSNAGPLLAWLAKDTRDPRWLRTLACVIHNLICFLVTPKDSFARQDRQGTSLNWVKSFWRRWLFPSTSCDNGASLSIVVRASSLLDTSFVLAILFIVTKE